MLGLTLRIFIFGAMSILSAEGYSQASSGYSLPTKGLIQPLDLSRPELMRQTLNLPADPVFPWNGLKAKPEPLSPDAFRAPPSTFPRIRESLKIAGRVAGFKTTDDHLYYVVPDRWAVAANVVTLESLPPSIGGKRFRLRFLLTPSYDWTDELKADLRDRDSLAFVVPIPKRFVGLRLSVPEDLGEIKSQHLPTDYMTIGEQIYMNIELSEDQLEVFKILNQASSFVTGTVSYIYPDDEKSSFVINSDIWLNFEKF